MGKSDSLSLFVLKVTRGSVFFSGAGVSPLKTKLHIRCQSCGPCVFSAASLRNPLRQSSTTVGPLLNGTITWQEVSSVFFSTVTFILALFVTPEYK